MSLCLKCLFLGFTVLVTSVKAQQGHFGHGHDKWHKDFYEGLRYKDTNASCCNLADCRPTSVRYTGAYYEVMVDGVWTPVPPNAIQNVTAPDLGAHVCAPKQEGTGRGVIYCVVLPPET
jgi:hypothetical protein